MSNEYALTYQELRSAVEDAREPLNRSTHSEDITEISMTKGRSTTLIRTLAAGILGAALMATGLATAWADPASAKDAAKTQSDLRHEWMAAKIKAKLDKMATRLQIRASQQVAWANYSKAISARPAIRGERLDHEANAVALSRFRADRASAIAAKLGKVADATAELQTVLTPEQRKTLSQIVRHHGHHCHHWGDQHGRHGHSHLQGWDHSDGRLNPTRGASSKFL